MASLSASDWVRAAARRLAAGGVDAVRVEPVAAELGVSKGSFYWHFTNRDALLDAVLDHWRHAGVADVVAQVERVAAEPEARLRELLRRSFEHTDQGFDVGVRAWAARDARARAAAGAVDAARTDYLARLLGEAGSADPDRRAAVVYRTLLGDYAMRHAGGETLGPDAIAALIDWSLAPEPSKPTTSGPAAAAADSADR
ncbi:TetR/AcrR family transcriptional regulator [Isoptericola croceus]|uniref:TetR/AcrR family transcriptional regulator n=1 Tax=Isoptericola croceus TaxID=3031406 RepID=UPI0023F9AC90|nr:TetR/AcrR family transcriptional regulator [Isoptericola croceus]